jgi:hypothetical protein
VSDLRELGGVDADLLMDHPEYGLFTLQFLSGPAHAEPVIKWKCSLSILLE